jgi:YfiH family protein
MPLAEPALVRPAWAAPEGVRALMSTRAGGVSTGALQSLNLGRGVGDDPLAVAENRRRFVATLGGARPVWLRQVHGTTIVRLNAASPEYPDEPADGAITLERGIACIVGAADCMPVLLATRDGRAVGAAHAGWRGLAAGVIEAAVRTLTDAAGVPPADALVWLGPCIGPLHFEVGEDVLQAFGVRAEPHDPAHDPPHFRWSPRADGAPRWRADLRGLGRERLARIGVREVSGDPACTYAEASRFFSFRRDRAGGRMAAAIWRV